MTSFSVMVKLCKDPDTGSPWLLLPHVSSQHGRAPAPCSLHCHPAACPDPAEQAVTSLPDFYQNRPGCPGHEEDKTGGCSWPLHLRGLARLCSMLGPASSGTLQARYTKKTCYHIVLYGRQKSSTLFLFRSVHQFRELQNKKAFPSQCLPLHYFNSKIRIIPFLLLGMRVTGLC